MVKRAVAIPGARRAQPPQATRPAERSEAPASHPPLPTQYWGQAPTCWVRTVDATLHVGGPEAPNPTI